MKKCLLKALSVVLCLTLVTAVLPVGASADSKELKFMVTTDTHFQCASDVGTVEEANPAGENTEGLLNADIYYHATFQGQMNHESEAIARSMLDDFVNSDSEYLLIGGDLTGGKRQSHIEFAQLLKDAEERSGKEIFVICGNHDCAAESSEKNIDINEFKEIYADFGFNEADSYDPASASYAVDLSDGYRLLAIDSCIYGKDDGKLSSETMEWVKAEAEEAKADGKNVIAMMHHSLLPHFTIQPMIDDYADFAEQFADMGIKLVFTGHIHANDISMANSKNGNTVYDIQTGSLITSPNAYRKVTLTDDEISIESRYVEKIDTKYLPEGFSPEQIKLMEDDFPTYAYGYFEAGICRWLNRYIGSAGKVGKLLKLTPGTTGYGIVDHIMRNIGEALTLPIYDDGSTPDIVDSIEEIAAIAGVELPESEYEMIYQLAAKIYNGFYHGDEAESIRTVEFPLFYACFKAVLARTITNLTFTTYTAKAFNSVMGSLFGVEPYDRMLTGAAKLNYSCEAADKILESVLYNVCDGLVTDLSEPSDINVTITGYGVNDTADKEFQLSVFRRIILFLKNMIVYIISGLNII